MKRSFSEFRTQRELGAKDLPKVMKKCTDALNHLKTTVRKNQQRASLFAAPFPLTRFAACPTDYDRFRSVLALKTRCRRAHGGVVVRAAFAKRVFFHLFFRRHSIIPLRICVRCRAAPC